MDLEGKTIRIVGITEDDISGDVMESIVHLEGRTVVVGDVFAPFDDDDRGDAWWISDVNTPSNYLDVVYEDFLVRCMKEKKGGNVRVPLSGGR